MKKLSLLLVLLFTFSSVFVYSQDDDETDKAQEGGCKTKLEKQVQKKYDKAIAARKKGDRETATELFKEVIEMDPEFANPYYFLGFSLIRDIENGKGNEKTMTDAIGYFEKCYQLCPDFNIYAFFYAGKLYYTMEQYTKAVVPLQEFVKNRDKIKNEVDFDEAESMVRWSKFYEEAYQNKVNFNPQIVKGVSSKYDDYLFCLTPDQEIMFYSRRIPQGADKTDIYQQQRDVEVFTFSNYDTQSKSYSNGEAMPFPFNQSKNEGGATITVNNKYMVFVRSVQLIDGYLNSDLFYSELKGEDWTEPKSLGNDINTPKTWETMPSISADGKTLYFVSDRPGGQGGYDIYMTTKKDNGTWGAPVNLGPTINTPKNEKTPFIHSDSQTLYFSSDGHMGFGGYDIFYSHIDESNGKWVAPKNIGFPINSDRDETGFFVSIDGSKGFYASNIDLNTKKTGDWNLFEFEMPESARPQKVVLIKGNVKTETGDIVEANVTLKNTVTKSITEIPIDNYDGNYATVALMKNDYILTVKKEGFAYETHYIETKKPETNVIQNVNIEVKPIEVGKSYNLNDIYFLTDSYELNSESKSVIDDFIEFMKDNKSIKVELQGHTDNVGSPAYNLTLSENRAKSVYEYIIQNGISTDRMTYKGYGQTKPIANNNTEEGKAKNRRTVFLITQK